MTSQLSPSADIQKLLAKRLCNLSYNQEDQVLSYIRSLEKKIDEEKEEGDRLYREKEVYKADSRKRRMLIQELRREFNIEENLEDDEELKAALAFLRKTTGALKKIGDLSQSLTAVQCANIANQALVVELGERAYPNHPKYGPCDAFADGECLECRNVVRNLLDENMAIRGEIDFMEKRNKQLEEFIKEGLSIDPCPDFEKDCYDCRGRRLIGP